MSYAIFMRGASKKSGSALIAGASKHGSALIMVMLVVAGITTIIFATQRIALVQFSQSVREEDNLSATYAAQAGIEDGLSRYRFERNSETGDDTMFRFNLTTGNYQNYQTANASHEIDIETDIAEGVEGDFDPKYQYYDLTMSYRTRSIGLRSNGDTNFASDPHPLKVDKAVTLTGFASNPAPYYLRYAFDFTGCSDSRAFVAVQQVVVRTGGNRTSSQVLAKRSQAINEVYDSYLTSTNMLLNDNGIYDSISVTARAYYCQVKYAFGTTAADNGRLSSNVPEFDGLITDIISSGYFGSAKRTLIARVDRQTGNLIGIFDYILYAGGSGGTIN